MLVTSWLASFLAGCLVSIFLSGWHLFVWLAHWWQGCSKLDQLPPLSSADSENPSEASTAWEASALSRTAMRNFFFFFLLNFSIGESVMRNLVRFPGHLFQASWRISKTVNLWNSALLAPLRFILRCGIPCWPIAIETDYATKKMWANLSHKYFSLFCLSRQRHSWKCLRFWNDSSNKAESRESGKNSSSWDFREEAVWKFTTPAVTFVKQSHSYLV